MNITNIKLIFTLAFVVQIVGCAQTLTHETFEDVNDAYPPGILLEETRGLVPGGIILREVYPKGIQLVKEFEGYRSRLYNDAVGYCTIGYGHLIKKSRCNGTEPREFRPSITEQKGEELLLIDMRWAKYSVQKSIRASLTDGQYAALVDFVFNVGSGNFQKSSIVRYVNANQHHKVPNQLKRWVKARKRILPGLVRRRGREIALYLEGIRVVPEVEVGLEPIDIEEGEK